jgi:tripartite-type tricarboxylate transporter receptor subunit TctC
MPHISRRTLLLAAAFGALSPARAQTTPTRPIRILVGFAPGGTADVVARIAATRLSDAFGQQVFVENKAGAGGTLAHAAAAQAPADGTTYTLATNSTFAIAQHLYRALPYDERALMPVALATSSAMALCVHPSVPANTIADLIALAKSKPDGLNFSSAGLGATSHLATELFMSMAGVRMSHVPYRAGSQAVQAVVQGDVQLAFVDVHAAKSLTEGGRVRMLGVTSLKRYPAMPDVPTVAESGLPGFEMATTTGLFAPAGIAPDILQRMEKEFVAALRRPDVQEQLRTLGMEVLAQDRAGLDAHMRAESAKWGAVIRERGIRLAQ